MHRGAPLSCSLQEFSTPGKSFVTAVAWLAGDPNLQLAYRHSHHPLAASLLALAFVFSLALVLLNLLTGLIVNSLHKVRGLLASGDSNERRFLSR